MRVVAVESLGAGRYPSPISCARAEASWVPEDVRWTSATPPPGLMLFEEAGPRSRLFFDPARTRAALVTCGGLCPGLNNVIRSAFLELHHRYGVGEVLGFRWGYQGLDPVHGAAPIRLTPEFVEDIHKEGGTILGTSRGPVDTAVAVDNLIRLGVDILLTVGGDGTQRGSSDLFLESRRRGHPLAVVGIPKTIDNDVPFVSQSFGFQTSVEEATRIIDGAHTEAHSVQNGISLVKVMGRYAGFIAAAATIANQDVNFTLVPEVPFTLDGPGGFLAVLKRRVLERKHAVIVVAEGAGQDLVAAAVEARDASGNAGIADVGVFLRDRITAYFKAEGVPFVLRYFDPSYSIRSRPADAEDAILCDAYARHAVHAGMAGRTGLVIGHMNDTFVHVPIGMLSTQSKRLDPAGSTWRAVLASTGQPESLGMTVKEE
jgi:6-phosphofructokinase 1